MNRELVNALLWAYIAKLKKIWNIKCSATQQELGLGILTGSVLGLSCYWGQVSRKSHGVTVLL
jgi:hypothetical protein